MGKKRVKEWKLDKDEKVQHQREKKVRNIYILLNDVEVNVFLFDSREEDECTRRGTRRGMRRGRRGMRRGYKKRTIKRKKKKKKK